MSEHNILGAILAGGQSKRMGKDKLFLELDNKKLIEHTIDKVKNFAKLAKNSFEKNTKSFDKEWKEFDKIMTKNNISRKECLLLPVNTTLDALNKKSL